MSSEQDAIRLDSSSSDEVEVEGPKMAIDRVQVAVHSASLAPKEKTGDLVEFAVRANAAAHALLRVVSEDEAEEKASEMIKRAANTPRNEERIVTDISTTPTRQQRKRASKREKNPAWPNKTSRKPQHRERRAPVRQGSTVYHARVISTLEDAQLRRRIPESAKEAT